MVVDLVLFKHVFEIIWQVFVTLGFPLALWAGRKWTRPLVELHEHVKESRTHWESVNLKVTELASHVLKQNGRVSALESRFHDHTQQDTLHQERIHADLRELFLRMNQAFNMTCFVPNCQHPGKTNRAQTSLSYPPRAQEDLTP